MATETSSPPATAALRLHALRKSFGGHVAVAGVSLTVRERQFFTLLGPSGSGKTTLLRLIAGFESPDSGRIELGGRDVTGLPPYARATNTVFQDYALFPHMTVADNIAYGLRVRHVPRGRRRQRVQEALAMVRLQGLGDRRPMQLSGGQRQRVALARAIVNEPRVLLLDEPLGALDLKLRQEMQLELKRIQREAGITFVYVTHDQEEALTMSDVVAVLDEGRVEQVATPVEIYEHPATEFVASFIGLSNLLDRGGRRWLLRPERVRILHEGRTAEAGDEVFPAAVLDVVYVGMVTRFSLQVDDQRLVAVEQNLLPAEQTMRLRGQRLHVAWRPEDLVELPAGQDSSPDRNPAGTFEGE